MSFQKWADSRVKQHGWFDIGLVKIAVAGFILMVAKLWPPILALDWYWYGLIGLLASLKSLSIIFSK
ncbi:MAG: hypothetical protein V1708_01325 [Candidatus Micrarchaeota archaeon]